jgi:hypothetical protein
MPEVLWRNVDARRRERYERRKIATQKAAEAKAEEESCLEGRWRPGRQSLRYG